MPANPFDPELFELFQALGQALIQYTPEHFRSAYCIAEQSANHGEGRLQYRIGSKDYPKEGTNRPSANIHEAVHQLHRYWTKNDQPFPGIEASVALQPDGNWKTSVRMLDTAAQRRPAEVEEKLWQDVYKAREALFVDWFGPLPNDIQKLLNLSGVWPGGGLFQIAASGGVGVCISCGLTNADMPTRVKLSQYQRTDQAGAPGFTATMEARTPRWVPPESAGYGYEVMVLTPKPETWPVLPVGWIVQMEILNDLDLPGRVDESQGVTVESVKIGDGTQSADFLIEPAQPPLPPQVDLPNGTMRLFVATRITRDEMKFALERGRPALMDRLNKAGVGQMSILDRASVLK